MVTIQLGHHKIKDQHEVVLHFRYQLSRVLFVVD